MAGNNEVSDNNATSDDGSEVVYDQDISLAANDSVLCSDCHGMSYKMMMMNFTANLSTAIYENNRVCLVIINY